MTHTCHNPGECTAAPLVAICGGIGAGKSVVSAILMAMGYPVYDCDSRAKTIMDTDAGIHSRLRSEIHPDIIIGGCIDRRLLAGIVFADSEKLAALNAIVHHYVLTDLLRWQQEQTPARPCFVETAIPRSSHIYDIVSDIWYVDAPEALRIARVGERSGLSPAQVLARIRAQQAEAPGTLPHHIITNDGLRPLLPQLHALLG